MRVLAIFSLSMFWLTTSLAQDSITPVSGDGLWFYELGGGDPYTRISAANKTRVTLGAGADWGLGGVCGFDPDLSFKNELKNAKRALHNLGRDVLDSARHLARAAVLSEIRAINPGRYDTLVRGVAEAKESVNVAIKSCEEFNANVMAGTNPVDGWIKISSRAKWAEGAASGENPADVHEEVLSEGGNDGVTWVGGRKAGGQGQPPIEVIGDTLGVGYESWDDQEANSSLKSVFPTKESAEEWTTAVVGEKIVRTCVDCPKISTKVGQGLKLQHLEERVQVFDDMVAVLNSDSLTASDLAKVSAPGMGIHISDAVIQGLRTEDSAEREVLVNRMASEIALARTIEKALLARSLLRAGLQDPNIQANGEALEDLRSRLDILNDEIDNTLFEQRVRSEVLTKTPQMILARAAQRQVQAGLDSLGKESGVLMQDGAVPLSR